MKKYLPLIIGTFVFFPSIALAHCPLCTVGAGFLAISAAYLGVSVTVVGIMIGAFAAALGLWTSKLIKKQYIPYQRQILAVIVHLTTVIPLMPLLKDYTSVNIYWFGEYGSMFNQTYLVNRYILGVILGTLAMIFSPSISKLICKLRKDKLFPYQGMAITLCLLLILSFIAQLAL